MSDRVNRCGDYPGAQSCAIIDRAGVGPAEQEREPMDEMQAYESWATWWTVLKTGQRRWAVQNGWDTREEAETDAKTLRRDKRRRCVVVRQAPGQPLDSVGFLTELERAVWA